MDTQLLNHTIVFHLKSWKFGKSLPLPPGLDVSHFKQQALGAHDLLLFSDGLPDVQFIANMRRTLSYNGVTILDVSGAWYGLRMAGFPAREVLESGCGLDLDPFLFPVGNCAATRLASLYALIHAVDARPTYEVFVPASYLAYLRLWVDEVAATYEPY